ncbi:MAG: hypothetical protein EB059_07235 [Alphaproteobacteria bacterium]|nr:hypothetical protein [Alphaproteobacteria bacterium]
MQWLIFGFLALVVISGVRRMVREAPLSSHAPFSSMTNDKKTPDTKVHEMIQCSTCQAFMVKNASACGREGCPFGK